MTSCFSSLRFWSLLDSGTPSNVRNISYVLKREHPITTVGWLALGRTAAYIFCAPLLYYISSFMAEHRLFQSLTSILIGLILVRICKLIWTSPADHQIPVYPSNGRIRLSSFGLKDKLYGIPPRDSICHSSRRDFCRGNAFNRGMYIRSHIPSILPRTGEHNDYCQVSVAPGERPYFSGPKNNSRLDRAIL